MTAARGASLASGRSSRGGSRRCCARPGARDAARGGRRPRRGRADLVGLLSRLAEQQAGLVAVLDGEADEFVYSAALDRRRDVDAEQLRAARLDVGEALAEGFSRGSTRSSSPRRRSRPATTSRTSRARSDSTGCAGHLDHAAGSRRPTTSSADGGLRPVGRRASRDSAATSATSRSSSRRSPRDGRLGAHALHEPARDGALYEVLAPRLERRARCSCRAGHVGEAPARRVHRRRAAVALRDQVVLGGLRRKGDTLRCVVVPKLPFGQMNDPLSGARAPTRAPGTTTTCRRPSSS